MSTLHLTIVPSADINSSFRECCIVLMSGTACPKSPRERYVYSYQSCNLQAIYRELKHLMNIRENSAVRTSPLIVTMDSKLIETLILLAHADDEAMLRIVLAYCLTVERSRCSDLLHIIMAADADFFEILHRYRLEPWPVANYAKIMNLSMRKFNQLFKEKFHISAKHWFHQQRLEHALQQLETTSKKVTDVALESGFSNPAHFSESFRRFFNQSPSEARRKSFYQNLSQQEEFL